MSSPEQYHTYVHTHICHVVFVQKISKCNNGGPWTTQVIHELWGVQGLAATDINISIWFCPGSNSATFYEFLLSQAYCETTSDDPEKRWPTWLLFGFDGQMKHLYKRRTMRDLNLRLAWCQYKSSRTFGYKARLKINGEMVCCYTVQEDHTDVCKAMNGVKHKVITDYKNIQEHEVEDLTIQFKKHGTEQDMAYWMLVLYGSSQWAYTTSVTWSICANIKWVWMGTFLWKKADVKRLSPTPLIAYIFIWN